ncbi:MAG: ion channel [Actinomycetota bacterium]|nr:ion channel [Actinomycetota bacterium]
MPTLIYRLWTLINTRLHGWRLPLVIAVVIFATSWLGMWLVEPVDNEITRPENYWWWFLVTAATVGYGDFFPTTTLGHVVGAYVIIGGIVTLTILFTRLASYLQTRKGKRMKGLVQLDVQDHTVILGYLAGRTERMIAELHVDGSHRLVLCAWDEVAEHPMPEQPEVQFVRGDLTSVDVMTRACVAQAATVIIDGRDDNETLAIALAVDHTNPQVHMVVALREMNRREQLRYVNPKIQCVQWYMPNLVTEEALDPGITQVYADLMSSGGGGNTYSVQLPDNLSGSTFGECQIHFGRHFSATLIAVRSAGQVIVSPRWDAAVEAGATLYYLAERRIDESDLAHSRR